MDRRPDFLLKLGLMLPCSPEDVRQAYREKVRTAHPDHGGDVAEFRAIQEAYEKALEYSSFLASRTRWLSSSVERYIQQQQFIEQVRKLGGLVHLEELTWLREEIGEDFAQINEVVVGIDLRGDRVGDDELRDLIAHNSALSGLQSLNLSDTRVTDRGLNALGAIPTLKYLALNRTAITSRGLRVLEFLTNLIRLEIAKTAVGRFAAWRAGRRYPHLEIVR